MSTELVRYSLHDQIEYAKLVTDGSTIIPDAYRGKPANALIAIGLGQAMGLSPAESLYRINVIQGKPTAAAELIAANVRKAGHKLRVVTDEQRMSVTATIIRADDPDFPHEVTRDMAWAKRMGLDKKDNYLKQPLTMLEWRAVTAVARKACSEALYGVQYTPDEMYDLGERPARAERPAEAQQSGSAVARLAAAAAQPAAPESAPEVDWYAEVDLASGDVDALRAIYGRASRAGADTATLEFIRQAGIDAKAAAEANPSTGELPLESEIVEENA